ncbi:hypothetical protein Tco_1268145, partial [Tanacetum coccineum]
MAVHNIKQREGESTRAFITRYTNDTLQILGLPKEHRISWFVHGLRTRSLVEFLSTDVPTTYKGLMEKTSTWIEEKDVATNGAPNDNKEGSKKFSKNFSWDHNKGKKKNRVRSWARNQPVPGVTTSDKRSCEIKTACTFGKGHKEGKGKDFRHPTG